MKERWKVRFTKRNSFESSSFDQISIKCPVDIFNVGASWQIHPSLSREVRWELLFSFPLQRGTEGDVIVHCPSGAGRDSSLSSGQVQFLTAFEITQTDSYGLPSTLYPQSILPKTNPIPYGAVFAVDDDIGLMLSGQGLGLVDGRTLFAVFGGNPFIPLAPHCPTVFVGNHVLVPGSGAGLFPPSLKQGGEQFEEGFQPRVFWCHVGCLGER